MKLENLTFRGGTRMEEYKELSSGCPIEPMTPPEKVILTMSQHIGASAKPIVKKGDHVDLGQKIAEAGGYVSAPVFASVSGEVVDIIDYLTSAGRYVPAVVIQNDGKDSLGYEKVNRTLEDLTPEDIVRYVQEAGIVGMGGAGFPTHVKLKPPKGTLVDTIVLNGAECEPYLTCDDQTMRSQPEKVVEGLKILMKATGAGQGYVAIEDNKPQAIEAIDRVLGNDPKMKVAVLKTKYPQGDEKRIIDAITGRHVPFGKLPADVGVVVDNIGTACAVVDACYYGKPLYERAVTLTGHGVNKPANLMVRFGTRIKDVVDFAGGYSSTPGKIIFGGPMMGVSVYTDEMVTDKRNNGILVMTQEETVKAPVDPCIRCARCVEVCPARLEPLYLATASKAENWEKAKKYHVEQCIECGLCSYICPAKRPLTELIRFGKGQVKAMARK